MTVKKNYMREQCSIELVQYKGVTPGSVALLLAGAGTTEAE
jgi:hypothetical protein